MIDTKQKVEQFLQQKKSVKQQIVKSLVTELKDIDLLFQDLFDAFIPLEDPTESYCNTVYTIIMKHIESMQQSRSKKQQKKLSQIQKKVQANHDRQLRHEQHNDPEKILEQLED